MRRSILDVAFVKKNITAFQISIALSPAPYRAITVGGRATQAKAWAKFPRPFGPTGPHADNGPKGQENIARALAWVGQRNTLRPVRAGEIHAPINSRCSVCQKEHYGV
jgi:hypothetical protein